MRTLVAGILLIIVGALMLASEAISDYFADWVVIAGVFVVLLGLVLALLHAIGERHRLPRHQERNH